MRKKVALIFGVTGQDGSYLSEILLKKNYIVHGVKRRSSSINTSRVDHIYQDPNEKNKLITEIFLKSKIKNNLISLRISNIIGKRIFSKNRNNHKLFLDHFINLKKKNKIFKVNDDFKDFISIYQFCYMVKNIIKKNIVGIYNVSLGEKVYISEITKWLNSDYSKKLVFLNKQKDSFTLKNNKLLDKIGIKINKKQLERFCKSLKI